MSVHVPGNNPANNFLTEGLNLQLKSESDIYVVNNVVGNLIGYGASIWQKACRFNK